MNNTEQLAYLSQREQQQQELAARAFDHDIRSFHEHLAEHYGRLLEEARESALFYRSR